jgi:hypothetical protein
VLVAGLLNGTISALDLDTPDRLRWRLALFRQVSTDLWTVASHVVSDLAFDVELQRIYVSALVTRDPFLIGEPIGPGQAKGFLAAYAWPSLRLLWRIWLEEGVGGFLLRSATERVLYTSDFKTLSAIDPASGEILRQFTQPESIFTFFSDPDRPGSLYLLVQGDSSRVRLRELDAATLAIVEEREFTLPTASWLTNAGFDPRRKLLHLLSSRWQVADLTGAFRLDEQLALESFQWLFLPGPGLPLVLTCCPFFSGQRSGLFTLDADDRVRVLWESEVNVGGFGASAAVDGRTVLLATASVVPPYVKPVEIIAIEPETGSSQSLGSFGSLRDAGRLLTIAGPCPEVQVPVGDCNADGEVTVDEVVFSVRLLLADRPVDRCPAIDQDGNNAASVEELIAAVHCILSGCGGVL